MMTKGILKIWTTLIPPIDGGLLKAIFEVMDLIQKIMNIIKLAYDMIKSYIGFSKEYMDKMGVL